LRVVCMNCAHTYMENRIVGRKLHYPVLASWTLRGQMVNKDDGVLSYCRKEAPLYIASKKRSPSIFAHHFCNLDFCKLIYTDCQELMKWTLDDSHGSLSLLSICYVRRSWVWCFVSDSPKIMVALICHGYSWWKKVMGLMLCMELLS